MLRVTLRTEYSPSRKRTQAHLLARRRDPRTPGDQRASQRKAVRMVRRRLLPSRLPALSVDLVRLIRFVPVDLPVDVVVVLEQQERADQAQSAEQAPREWWCVL
jgi:hypothetical protein